MATKRMTARILSLLLVAAMPSLVLARSASPRQDDPDVTRSTFLVTRKPPASAAASGTSQRKSGKSKQTIAQKRSIAPLALAYTIFMKGPDGDPVRVDPSKVFHQGDGVRVLVESNADGYLYVFTTENAGQPRLIYPDPRIDDGRNRIVSHVPRVIPSNSESRGKFRWFSFDKVAATERLFFVLARQPLPGIPTGAELGRYCTSYDGACPLQPSAQVWATLTAVAARDDRVSKQSTYGAPQTTREAEAVTRGIVLAPDDAEPSIIQMSPSEGDGIVVVTLVLEHE